MSTAPQINERTVYLTNYRGQEITDAKSFGKVKFITTGNVIDTFRLDQLAGQVFDALKTSKPEDWLVPTGHMVLGALAILELLRRHGRVNLLLWHARIHKYIPRTVILKPNAQDLSEPALQELVQSEVPIDIP
jgi:hypothetical protein